MSASRPVKILAVIGALSLLGGAVAMCGGVFVMLAQQGSESVATSAMPERFAMAEEEYEGAKDNRRQAASSPKRSRSMEVSGGGMPGSPPPPPSAAPAAAMPEMGDMLDGVVAAAEPEADAPTRAWFPETFLFAPEVVTDASGGARVTATMPDRLTTYRVLGLAWDRAGHTAGDVASVATSMPLYADPVIPEQLRVGDRIRWPVAIVNTTDRASAVDMRVAGEGIDVRGGGQVAVPALGSGVIFADLAAGTPGLARLQADLWVDGVRRDGVSHEIPVVPTGRPLSTRESGVLGAGAKVEMPLPADGDPDSARMHLLVVPGGLGVLQSEVTSAAARANDGVAAAQLLTLAAVTPGLWAAAGLSLDTADAESRARAETLRSLRLLGTQRALAVQGSGSLEEAIALTSAAALHENDVVLQRLADRGVSTLGVFQRPDGTFGGDASGTWTVQRMLVATAFAVDAARVAGQASGASTERQRTITQMAVMGTGAAERYAPRVADAYTAAALLSAGLVQGDDAARLLTLVRESVTKGAAGAVVSVPAGVVRLDGTPPGASEVAARVALALHRAGSPDDAAMIADLGARVLSTFVPGVGWGDAWANREGLAAVAALWAAPPTAGTTLTLLQGGNVVASRVLTVEDLRNPVYLNVPAKGRATWRIAADPPVPGLAWALEAVSYGSWTHAPVHPGIDVEVVVPRALRVGADAELVVEVSGARRALLRVDIALPAGVVVDEDAVQADEGGRSMSLVQTTVRAGSVTVDLPPLSMGRATVHIPVRPTLAGIVWSGPVSVSDRRKLGLTQVPPTAWSIAGG